MKPIIKILSFIFLVFLIGGSIASCKHWVKPLDGPGMERDSADYASGNGDSLEACNTDKVSNNNDSLEVETGSTTIEN